tara:strand:+ start:6996 stop:7448 length:453 start_codon:yes stop_codon:yes gene_type:complete
MKLFINILNINFLNINTILKDLEKYKYKTNNISLIFTENYILQNIHNCIYKVNIIDSNTEILKYNKYDIICDNSKFIKEEEWYQIPYNHILNNTKQIYYRLREKAIISLVIEKDDINNLIGCFFYTNEKLVTSSMIQDINSFLSLLKINL